MRALVTISAVLLASYAATASAASETEALSKAKDMNLSCKSSPKVQRVEINQRYAYETAKDPEHTEAFYIVTCATGTNGSSSVLLSDDGNSGLHAVPLAIPVWNDKSKIVGYASDIVVPELVYKSETQDFVSSVKAKPVAKVAQTSSTSDATYHLVDGKVILRDHKSATAGKTTVLFHSTEDAKVE